LRLHTVPVSNLQATVEIASAQKARLAMTDLELLQNSPHRANLPGFLTAI
jgi:hypothetical protein